MCEILISKHNAQNLTGKLFSCLSFSMLVISFLFSHLLSLCICSIIEKRHICKCVCVVFCYTALFPVVLAFFHFREEKKTWNCTFFVVLTTFQIVACQNEWKGILFYGQTAKHKVYL